MTARWVPLALLAAQSCAKNPAAPAKARPDSAAAAPAAALSGADARHVLNRLAFGARPGQAAALSKQGLDEWITRQLALGGPEPAGLASALQPHASALLPPDQLVAEIAGDDWMSVPAPKLRKLLAGKSLREHLGHIALAKLTRHVLSERQLEEVMVDFWTDHFNVFARKGAVRVFAGDYIERAIRPHALGKFQDLLLATARHPAMLLYLDNARSVVPRGGKRGLNENYARELLELHTLGVHGGYTQADVVGVARILTGWSVTRPQEGNLEFLFRARAHDGGAKRVLGVDFPAGGAQAEGVKLLNMLAAHPATAKHLATKLCQRLVRDTPPADVVHSAAAAFQEGGGDIKALIRAIVSHDAFWAPESRAAKLKSPLEIVVSSLRALDAKPDGSLRLARVLARMGQPILLESAPTGYAEVRDAWLGSSAMLGRMSFATALATKRKLGADFDLESAAAGGAFGHGSRARDDAAVRRPTSRGRAQSRRERGVGAAHAGTPPRPGLGPAARRSELSTTVRSTMSDFSISRRSLLFAASLTPAALLASRFAWAAEGPRPKTLVCVFLRGGLDGLSAVVPYAEDAYYGARSQIAVAADKALKLDERFALHPSLAPLMPAWKSEQLAFVHAVGSPHPTRSHFEAQDHFEWGSLKSAKDGWLARARRARNTNGSNLSTVALARSTPLAFRGQPDVVSASRLDAVGLLAPPRVRDRLESAFAKMYAADKDVIGRAGSDALAVAKRLRELERDASDCEVPAAGQGPRRRGRADPRGRRSGGGLDRHHGLGHAPGPGGPFEAKPRNAGSRPRGLP